MPPPPARSRTRSTTSRVAPPPGLARARHGVVPVDPVLRNALRYTNTISAREYAVLHRYMLARCRLTRRAAPAPASVARTLRAAGDDQNPRAVRHALRVFAATWLGAKGWGLVAANVAASDGTAKEHKKSPPALRLSLSLSSILLFYRFLFRFLSRLRAHLLEHDVDPFRRRNPRTAAALTSPYAPAVGASLAGLGLGLLPPRQLRVSVAVYMLFRALDFAWNACEMDGLVWGSRAGKKRNRPWWFGSWLLHACVFDRDCFPDSYGALIFRRSSAYLPARPADWPRHLGWPATNDVVESLAQMTRLNWPAYISPTLFPHKEVLPPSLEGVSPLRSRAHPLITSLSCATLHPSDPSCLRTYLTFWLNSFPPLARFFLVVYGTLTVVPRLGRLYHRPVAKAQRIVVRALATSTFVTGAMSTAWAFVFLSQALLPRHVLATQRFFVAGFVAGLWAWVERRHGRAVFLHSARASVDSLWKVGVKHRCWRAMRGGDVWVFVLALMVTGAVYERDARAIREGQWRRGVSWVRGEGWRDWGADGDDDDDDGSEGRKLRDD